MIERRPPPPCPYVPHDAVLVSHLDVLDRLACVADSYRGRDLEWCALLFGTRTTTGSVVETVVVPRQINHWGFYDVPADAMAEASAAVGDQLLVAQLHAHPGRDVEHSRVDDAKAASVKILSLVVPFYGEILPRPTGMGVHEHQSRYWHLLDRNTAARRVRFDGVAPTTLTDLR